MNEKRTPTKLGVHPHGLTAKHEARGEKRRRSLMTTTPLINNKDDGLVSRTSPRRSNIVNLESIRKSKLKIDKQYKLAFDDRINKTPNLQLDQSSPISMETMSSPIKKRTKIEIEDDYECEEPRKPMKLDFEETNASAQGQKEVEEYVEDNMSNSDDNFDYNEEYKKVNKSNPIQIESEDDVELQDQIQQPTPSRSKAELITSSPHFDQREHTSTIHSNLQSPSLRTDHSLNYLYDFKNDLQERLDNVITTLQHQLHDYKTTESALRDQLRAKDRELSNSNSKLKKKIVDLEEYIQVLNSDIQLVNDDNHLLNDKTTSLRNEKIELTLKIDEIIKETEEFKNDKKKLMEEKDELQFKLEDLKTSTVSISSYNSLRDEYNTLTSEVDTINQELDDIKSNSIPLQEYQKLESDLADKQAELEKFQQKIYESISLEEYEHVKSEVESLESRLKAKEEDISNYRSKMDEMLNVIEVLKSNNDKITKEKSALSKQQDLEVTNLAKYLHKEYAEKHAKKLGEVKHYYESEKNDYLRKIKNYEREIALLKNSISHENSSFQK
ncbi:unnamed protein product [Candida verbasci]|uniref:Uncharacterized protein n=1 Tax=Candida verbasci TaxID=1227364 RepID=A0A9W4TZU3_9ASCO|nr:unnamed protein product [Candida verbasci]